MTIEIEQGTTLPDESTVVQILVEEFDLWLDEQEKERSAEWMKMKA